MVLLLALVYRSTYRHTLSQVAGQLNFTHAVLSNELRSHRQAQSAMADLIAKDFTLLGEIADLIASHSRKRSRCPPRWSPSPRAARPALPWSARRGADSRGHQR